MVGGDGVSGQLDDRSQEIILTTMGAAATKNLRSIPFFAVRVPACCLVAGWKLPTGPAGQEDRDAERHASLRAAAVGLRGWASDGDGYAGPITFSSKRAMKALACVCVCAGLVRGLKASP